MTHRFTKGVRDHACGQLELARSRIAEHIERHKEPPRMLVLHGAAFTALVQEVEQASGNPNPAVLRHIDRLGTIMVGELGMVPVQRCRCTTPFEPDLLVHADGHIEEL